MTNRAGFAATVLGADDAPELLVINLAFTADSDFVYLLGRPINVACAARQRFGVPCPTCGLTRGFVLTVHGHVREAWRLSPTGPLAVGWDIGDEHFTFDFRELGTAAHPGPVGWDEADGCKRAH